MKTLFDIKNEYLDIINQVEEMEGEITPELSEQLAINEEQLQTKSIGYVAVIRQREALNELVSNEIKRLQAIKKRNDTLIDNLENRLLDAVKTFGSFESGLTKFGTRKSESIEVEDVNLLPTEFKTIKVTETADKTALKKAIKEGQEIKGVVLVEHSNLKIN